VIDRAVVNALTHSGRKFEVRDFSPYGYDERQYCSPGFNLPVGSLTRTPHGQFPEYHTSADNLDLVRPEALGESLRVYLSVVRILENNRRYLNRNPKCEPQLGKRGLYRALGGHPSAGRLELALLWVLNFSDGEHALLDIAERAQLPFEDVLTAAKVLERHGLLVETQDTGF
jgi:aminopeptidase-like protein